jgi:hypothetical protein
VDFLLQRQSALKYHKSVSFERIDAEIRSLSILCVGGRGQPMLAGRRGGGGYGAEKVGK